MLFMGKFTNSMVIFHSYVMLRGCLPEVTDIAVLPQFEKVPSLQHLWSQ